ncbi:hypothetical protein AB0L88_35520 [Saccharopolyspora shandongensis]|uniref:hypothetical protein n=1 Tax=Saccharopolyspora shandongensis TaxID=418495 RepID=UPI003442FF95
MGRIGPFCRGAHPARSERTGGAVSREIDIRPGDGAVLAKSSATCGNGVVETRIARRDPS